MKPPNTVINAQKYAAQGQRHSSLLLWAVLFMVVVSGLVYLGFKIKQNQASTPPSTLKTPPKLTTETNTSPTPVTEPTFDHIFTLLQAQKQINSVIYKTKILMPTHANDATFNQDVLWQQDQKQLTQVTAKLHAAVDLGALTPQNLSLKSPITLQLPPAHITQIQIENITMYDVKTGRPSTVQMGLSLTSAQEREIQMQVSQEFCQSKGLEMLTEETRQHVIAFLDALGSSVIVRMAQPEGCQQLVS